MACSIFSVTASDISFGGFVYSSSLIQFRIPVTGDRAKTTIRIIANAGAINGVIPLIGLMLKVQVILNPNTILMLTIKLNFQATKVAITRGLRFFFDTDLK